MMERAHPRSSRAPLHAFLVVAMFAATACPESAIRTDEPPPEPPQAPVVLVGDGSMVAGSLGPSGGTLALSPDGPRLEVPAGAIGPDGLLLSMRVDEGEGPPEDSTVAVAGPLLLVRPMFEPPSGKELVLSVPLSWLPPDLASDPPRLAVERPGAIGPGDGHSSPALTWEFLPATWEEGHAVAKVPQLRGMRLQFVVPRNPNL